MEVLNILICTVGMNWRVGVDAARKGSWSNLKMDAMI